MRLALMSLLMIPLAVGCGLWAVAVRKILELSPMPMPMLTPMLTLTLTPMRMRMRMRMQTLDG